MNISKMTKRSVIAVTLILFATFGVFANGASESAYLSGTIETAVTETVAFSDLNVTGVQELIIQQGATELVKITGDSALVDTVKISNEGGYLSIVGNEKNPLDVTVEITTLDVDGLMLSEVADATLIAWDMDHDFTVVLNDDASLKTVGTLATQDFYLYNRGGDTSNWNVDADMVVIESDSGEIAMSGKADTASATVTMDGVVALADLDIQNGYLALSNDGVVNANFPGVSSVSVQTSQDASATIDMNGMLEAYAYGDSSIAATGDIAHSKVSENGDASISVS